MAFYRGQQGTIKFDKDAGGAALSEIAAVRSWSLSVEKESLEARGLSSDDLVLKTEILSTAELSDLMAKQEVILTA